MSNPTDEDWKRMSKLVDTFYSRADAEPFRVPVDWKGFGLMDYPKIIKHPMDLGTIQSRLKKGTHYQTLYQVAEDVRLVWTNCMTYNADGSDFYKLAESLNKKWDDKYTKLLKDCNHNVKPAPASKSSDEKVSLQEKKNFAKSLYTISKEDLGRILVEVEQKCPEAIVRNSTEDEVEFNIDKLSSQLISDLTGFVNNAKGKKKAPSGKAKVAKA